MKTTTMLAMILAMSVNFATPAFADNDRRDRGRDHERQVQRGGHDGGRHNDGYRNHRSSRYDNDRQGRGVGRNHGYYRGDRLPMEYRSRSYVVDDWRGHRLSSPPRGHHWVQTGPDYVLVAITSGIIAQIMLNH